MFTFAFFGKSCKNQSQIRHILQEKQVEWSQEANFNSLKLGFCDIIKTRLRGEQLDRLHVVFWQMHVTYLSLRPKAEKKNLDD